MKFTSILSGLLLLCVSSVSAIEVKDLYRVDAAIADQSPKARQQGIGNAFSQMLVKISGRSDILQQPGIAAELKSANGYVEQYQYQRTEQGLQLRVQFNADKVAQMLRQNQIAVWGNLRPQILVWLVTEQDAQYQFVLPDTMADDVAQLQTVADSRGLPLLFARSEQIGSLLPLDIMAQSDWLIADASSPLAADKIVVAKFLPVPVSAGDTADAQWQLDWYFNDQVGQNFSATGERTQVLAQFIEQVADNVAAEYAINSVPLLSPQTVQVRVFAANNIEQMMAVERRLQGFLAVKSVQLTEKSAEFVSFSLTLQGGAMDLQRALQLDKRFEVFDSLTMLAGETPQLEVRWQAQ